MPILDSINLLIPTIYMPGVKRSESQVMSKNLE